jgi:hypothetical protein
MLYQLSYTPRPALGIGRFRAIVQMRKRPRLTGATIHHNG